MGPAKRWGAVGKELHTALHVVAWCQIGVILRVELDALFGGACASGLGEYSWAPCVTSSAGALLTDFPPNVLGSFLMGMLASSDVLSKHLGHTLDAPAPLAALPRGSSLQAHTAFQVGMRTGFCGSLTTFSSWMMQVVWLMVGGPTAGKPTGDRSLWVRGIYAIIINITACMSTLVMGQHMCLLIYHKLNPGSFTPRGEYTWRSTAPKRAPSAAHSDAAPATGPSAAGLTHRASALSRAPSIGRGSGPGSFVIVEDRRSLTQQRPDEARAQADAVAAALGGPAGAADAERVGSLQLARISLSGNGAGGSAAGDAVVTAKEDEAPSPDVELVILEDASVGYPLAWIIADGLAAASLLLVTGIYLWLLLTRDKPPSNPFRSDGFAIAALLGPVGAMARFKLARLNGSMAGRLSWFPLGTFIANMFACVVNYCIRAGLDLTAGTKRELPYMQAALLSGVMLGFSGSLSTVSTWVVELQLLMLTFPAQRRGYNYLVISVVVAVVLGLLIYGIPNWVTYAPTWQAG